MYHMGSPEVPTGMADAVKPVAAEVISEYQQYPYPPLGAVQCEYLKLVDTQVHCKNHSLGAQSHDHVTNSHGQAAESIFGFEKALLFYGAEDHRSGEGLGI